MKRIFLIAFILLIASISWAGPEISGGGTGTGDMAKTTYDTDTNNVVDTATLGLYLKSVATTGKISITGPAAGSTRAKTVRDVDDTILELGGSYTPSGTWDWTSATVTWPTFNQNTTGTAANVSGTPALPNGTTATTQSVADNSTKLATTAQVKAEIDARFSGSITDEQLLCGENTDGTNRAKSCGAKTVNNATATHLLCSDDSNEVENCTLSGLAITGTTSPTITVVGLQNGTDPTVDAAGEVAIDTDGANVTGDVSVRMYDGTNQVLLERKLKTIHVTVVKPQDLADAVRDAFPIWSNETGMTFTITSIKAWSGTDNATFMVEKSDANGANKADVDELDCTTDGTGVYTDTETTITSATVTAGQLLWLDFDDTDDPAWVKVTIEGWFNADVD